MQSLWESVAERKRFYFYLRWGVLAFLSASVTAICVTLCVAVIGHGVFLFVISFGYVILTVIVLLTAVLMLLAMRTFINIVSRLSDRRNFNQCFVWAQITCVVMLGIVWLSQGLFVAFHLWDFFSYDSIRYIVILDGLSFIVCLGSFLTMAFAILKSTQVQCTYTEDSEVS